MQMPAERHLVTKPDSGRRIAALPALVSMATKSEGRESGLFKYQDFGPGLQVPSAQTTR